MATIDLRNYTEAVKLTRDLVFNEKYRLVTANGRIRREIGGVYYNYSFELGNVDEEKYDQLWQILSEPAEYHTFIMPIERNKTINIEGILEGISDQMVTEDYDGNRHWDNLTLNVAMSRPL